MTDNRTFIPSSRGTVMIGHEPRYSVTNQRRLILLCECGWIGTATTWRTIMDPKTKRQLIQREATYAAVDAEHEIHLVDVNRDIVARSERVLAANAEAIGRVIPTILRPGRFGHR